MKGAHPILSFDEAFTSGPPQLRLLKCLFLLCRSDGTIFFVFEKRARKKVDDYKYDERMSDLGMTARE